MSDTIRVVCASFGIAIILYIIAKRLIYKVHDDMATCYPSAIRDGAGLMEIRNKYHVNAYIGTIVIDPHGDECVIVGADNDGGHSVVVQTKQGKGIYYDPEKITFTGRKASYTVCVPYKYY